MFTSVLAHIHARLHFRMKKEVHTNKRIRPNKNLSSAIPGQYS